MLPEGDWKAYLQGTSEQTTSLAKQSVCTQSSERNRSEREGRDVHILVERRVVQHRVQDLLVLCDVARRAFEDLSEGEDARGVGEGGPEVFTDVLDGVDSDAIDAIKWQAGREHGELVR
jgi:hypothetical protein